MLGEELAVKPESGNQHDRYAVSVKKDDRIIGHVPRSFSRVSWFFLSHRGRIKCAITGRKKHGLCLEVPSAYIFIRSPRAVKKLKALNITALVNKSFLSFYYKIKSKL